MTKEKFALGTSLLDKIHVTLARIFGCDHPDNMVVDVGDEDRGTDWYCFNCQRKI